MNKILYFFPLLLLTSFILFQNQINENLIISSLFSVLFFFNVFIISNIINNGKAFFIFFSSIYLLCYDILTLNAVGISIFSFSLSSILYNFIKQNYKNNILLKHYLFINIVFFLSLFLLNYFVFNNLNIEVFLLQTILSSLLISFCYYFFGKYNIEEEFIVA